MTGQLGRGDRANEYEALSAVVKLNSNPDKEVYWRLGFYYHEWDSEGMPGVGSGFSSGKSLLRDKDETDFDTSFAAVNAMAVKHLPADIKVELQGYYIHSINVNQLTQLTLLVWIIALNWPLGMRNRIAAAAVFFLNRRRMPGIPNGCWDSLMKPWLPKSIYINL